MKRLFTVLFLTATLFTAFAQEKPPAPQPQAPTNTTVVTQAPAPTPAPTVNPDQWRKKPADTIKFREF